MLWGGPHTCEGERGPIKASHEAHFLAYQAIIIITISTAPPVFSLFETDCWCIQPVYCHLNIYVYICCFLGSSVLTKGEVGVAKEREKEMPHITWPWLCMLSYLYLKYEEMRSQVINYSLTISEQAAFLCWYLISFANFDCGKYLSPDVRTTIFLSGTSCEVDMHWDVNGLDRVRFDPTRLERNDWISYGLWNRGDLFELLVSNKYVRFIWEEKLCIHIIISYIGRQMVCVTGALKYLNIGCSWNNSFLWK